MTEPSGPNRAPSVGALVAQDGVHGLEDYRDVEPKGPVLYVVEVQADHVLEGEVAPAADLPVPADARYRRQAHLVPLGHPLEVPHGQRPRPDQAHLPQQHVYELGQLVYAPTPDELADPRDARVVLHLEDGAVGLVLGLQLRLAPLGVLVHRAELVAEEDLPIGPDALLLEEDRPRGGELYQDGDRQEERREDEEPEGGTRDVEKALEGPLGVVELRVVHLQERQPRVLEEHRLRAHEGYGAGEHLDLHLPQTHGVQELQ